MESAKAQDVTEEGEPEAAGPGRFTLDTVIEDEGNNLSVGQRSLVSLARALVKDSKVLILDEATGTTNLLPGWYHGNADLLRFAASVDYETDKKIQDTIASEFEDRTILCIARKFQTSHRGRRASILTITPIDRLQTIIGYDRICVMDAGRIAEFDTPTRLFDMEGGIFRGMCDRSKISLEDIRRAAKLREE